MPGPEPGLEAFKDWLSCGTTLPTATVYLCFLYLHTQYLLLFCCYSFCTALKPRKKSSLLRGGSQEGGGEEEEEKYNDDDDDNFLFYFLPNATIKPKPEA